MSLRFLFLTDTSNRRKNTILRIMMNVKRFLGVSDARFQTHDQLKNDTRKTINEKRLQTILVIKRSLHDALSHEIPQYS
jgi:hypothetical protein